MVLLPHDELFHPGQQCENAYCVTCGTLTYFEHNVVGSHLAGLVAKLGKPVGLERWVSWVSLWCHWFHVGMTNAVVQCVRVNHLTRNLFEAYALSFHGRVVAASETSDLDTPFTEHRDSVWNMDREHKWVFSMSALEALRAQHWRTRLRSNVIERLQAEVASGSSILVESAGSPDVERVVAVTSSCVTLNDGRVLACLLKYRDHEGMVVVGRLVGARQMVVSGDEESRLERADEALDRIVCEQLAPLAQGLQILRALPCRDDRVHMSAEFKLRTQYLRTVYLCGLSPGFENLPRLRLRNGVLPRSQTCRCRRRADDVLPPLEDCFALRGPGNSVSTCAWVTSEKHVELLSRRHGRHELQRFGDFILNACLDEVGSPLFRRPSSRTRRLQF